MAVALEQFVKQLTDSGVIAPGKLEKFIPPQAAPKDAQELARQLVQSKQLTKFQVQEIYLGRQKSLILGNYTILDKIGAGGMGQVFKAEHRRMHRLVAIKMLPTATMKDVAAAARFQREVEAAAKLEHPNIVTAYDADEANGVHFLVMQFAEGSDLSALAKKNGPFSVAKAVNYILQAARGLEYAHKHGVVHRDIKPANLLLSSDGTVKILDMGLARIEGGGDTATQAELTGTGAVLGTVDYMAPEQALSTKHVDGRADIYSLGCSLFYLITAHAAYDGDSLMAKLLAHREQPIPSLGADVPEDVQAVFQKMVAKKVQDRYQTMSEVVAALEQCSSGQQTSVSIQQSVDTNLDADVLTFLRDAPPHASHIHKTTKKAVPTKTAKDKKKLILGAVGAGFLGLAILAGVLLKLRTKDGTLVVEVNQPDAVVQVLNAEGKVEVSQPGEKGAISISVDPGKHRLKVEKDGFQFFAQDFEMESGGTQSIKAKLIPLEGKPVAAGTEKPLAFKTPGFDQWMKMVAALPAEQQVEAVSKKLRELNPGFDGKVMLSNTPIAGPPRIENGAVTEMGFFTDKVTDISPVRVLSGLKSLDCLGSDYNGILTDISPLQGMQLTNLILVGNRKLTDISPLKGMPLTFLWLGAADQLFDLSPLKGMPLTELGVRATAVGDLSPLRGMKLTTLDIFDCRNVSDLSPLKGMNLESLVVSQTKVSDLSVLAGMPLKDLQLDFKPERDKELLRSIKTLEKISNKPAAEFWKEVEEQQKGKKLGFQVPGFDAWMKDVSALPAEQLVKAVVKKLRELNPGFDGKVFSEDWNSPPKIENGVVTQLAFKTDDVSDISPVHALTGLKVLLCSMAENPGKGSLADLSPLVGLKLMRLGIAGTEVSDLSPLAGMPIVEINCSVTRIADLSPLRGMTSLQILGFEKTLVSSLLPLRGMHLRALNCESTRVTDLSPLEGMSLIEFAFTPRKTNTGIDVIRRMKVVNSIGVDWNHLLPPPEFWKRFDAGEFGKPNSTAATPDHKPITNINDPAFQQWMKTVAAMPADKQVEAVSKKLVELNPGFDGKLTGGNGKEWSMIRNGVVEEVKFCTDNVTDISPLRVFQRLTLLRCSPAFPNKSKLSDLSPLQGMPLTLFECTFSNVSNLTPLQGMPITILSCEATLVADLSPLRGIPLRELNFHNTQVSDLSPLKGMPLTKLNCYGTQVSDLSPLQGMNLVEIDITPKNITKGLDVIRQMKSLNRIEIGWRESDKFSVSEFWKKYDDGEFNK